MQKAMGSMISSNSASAIAENPSSLTTTLAATGDMAGPSQAGSFIVDVRDLSLYRDSQQQVSCP